MIGHLLRIASFTFVFLLPHVNVLLFLVPFGVSGLMCEVL